MLWSGHNGEVSAISSDLYTVHVAISGYIFVYYCTYVIVDIYGKAWD